jgi:hypothetical protein
MAILAATGRPANAGTRVTAGRENVVQPLLEYEGKTYKSFISLPSAAKELFNKSDDSKKREKLQHPTEVYKLVELSQGAPKPAVDFSNKEEDKEVGPLSQLLSEQRRMFQPDEAYFVTVDEGAGFRTGTSEALPKALGTSGLSGCVAVLIKATNGTNQGYFASHIFSEHYTREAIEREAGKILEAMNDLFDLEGTDRLTWADFAPKKTKPYEVTLVRNGAGSAGQRTYGQLAAFLQEKGVEFKQSVSSSALMDLTPGADFYKKMAAGVPYMKDTEARSQFTPQAGFGGPV